MSEPVRTCLGCRRKRGQTDMIRIVRSPDGEAVFDVEGKLPGRGAYVCPSEECVVNLRASALSHTLKGAVTLPAPAELTSRLSSALSTKCKGILTIGRMAGQIAVGAEAVRESLRRDRASLLLVAADASARTFSSLELRGVQTVQAPSKDRLGEWLGRSSVAVAAVTDRGLARHLARHMGRLTAVPPNSYHGASVAGAEED